MRVALAQINATIGDFNGNCEKIIKAARTAQERGAIITIFSELCITGYPPRDLLEKPAFIEAQERALDRLRKELKDVPVVVGYVSRRYDGIGNLLYNSAAFILNGDLEVVGRKCLLPTYDVFDESRYFSKGDEPACFEYMGLRWGLSICEDVWNDKDFWEHRLYDKDPVEDLIKKDIDILINVSASPYHLGKQTVKEAMLSSLARKHRTPLLHANQVGGNDELLFDGRSMAFNASGKLLARGAAFEEDVIIVDIAEEKGSRKPRLNDMEELHKALVMGVKDYANKCGFDGGVLGLSGGIDSALVAVIAAEAFGSKDLIGVAMPSRYNSKESLEDARDLAARLGIDFHILPIEKPFAAYKEMLAPIFAGRPEDTTEENLQARIRGGLLMAISNKFGHLLLTTGNKSEVATGYCTLYGDMCGGLAVISDLYKTTAYTLAKHLNAVSDNPPIPVRCITKPPSAELRPDQKDEDSLPPYDILDSVLKAYIEKHKSLEQIMALGYDYQTVRRIIRLVDFNEYKRRQAAPGLKITSKAFGIGRRMPIAQRYRQGEDLPGLLQYLH